MKELLQNADDAGAKHVVFGYHVGFPKSKHRLLNGPALWVWNDGRFTSKDNQAIKFFGINNKAGESQTIGKFGLGMKSVFHLCECFFYIAKQGNEEFKSILNPRYDDDPKNPFNEWEKIDESDYELLSSILASEMRDNKSEKGFLLWIPLRKKDHVNQDKNLPIVARFPGEYKEGDTNDLDFFTDLEARSRIGELLPILKHIEVIRFKAEPFSSDFETSIQSDTNNRLDHSTDGLSVRGHIHQTGEDENKIAYYVRQQKDTNLKSIFQEIKSNEKWPSVRKINEGRMTDVKDKAEAQAALMYSRKRKKSNEKTGRLIIQWAVFLPLEEESHLYSTEIRHEGEYDYKVIIHAQFFIDAGRRGISERTSLHVKPPKTNRIESYDDLSRTWNQSLAQQMALPMFLEVLSEFSITNQIDEPEITRLASAIMACRTRHNEIFFALYKEFICQRCSWVYGIEKNHQGWRLVDHKKGILTLPGLNIQAQECKPWEFLPGLERLTTDFIFIDREKPNLTIEIAEWTSEHLMTVLDDVRIDILGQGNNLTYFTEFLKSVSNDYLTSDVQNKLTRILRAYLQQYKSYDPHNPSKALLCLTNFVSSRKKYTLPVKAVPVTLYNAMLDCDTNSIPLTQQFGCEAADNSPYCEDLISWLKAMCKINPQGQNITSFLDLANTLIQSCAPNDKARLLDETKELKILKARQIPDERIVPISLAELTDPDHWIFRLTAGHNPMGLLQNVSKVFPDIKAFVIEAQYAGYMNVGVSGSPICPPCDDIVSIFDRIGKSIKPPLLGDMQYRKNIIQKYPFHQKDDFSNNIKKVIRYLIHGRADLFHDEIVLWRHPSDEQAPWIKLWKAMNDPKGIFLDENTLIDTIPALYLNPLHIHEINAKNLISSSEDLRNVKNIDTTIFTNEEVDIILSNIEVEQIWKGIPLHLDMDGKRDILNDKCYLVDDDIIELPHKGLKSGIRFIVKSKYIQHLAKQRVWIPAWNAVTATNIVLESQEPHLHWKYLMDKMCILGDPTGEHLKLWQRKKWVPLTRAEAGSLEMILTIPGLDEEIQSLIENEKYIGIQDLHKDLKTHKAYVKLTKYFPDKKATLDALTILMERRKIFVGNVQFQDISKYINHLEKATNLKAWKIINLILRNDEWLDIYTQNYIGLIQKDISKEEYISLLKIIPKAGNSKEIKEIYNKYLRASLPQIMGNDKAITLRSLQFLNKNGVWASAGSLVYDLRSADNSQQLDDEHAKILIDYIEGNHNRKVDTIYSYKTPQFENLEKYIEPLRHRHSLTVPLGTLVALFAKPARELSETLLQPLCYEDILTCMGWSRPEPKNPYDGVIPIYGNCNALIEAMDQVKIQLRVIREDVNTISAISILGELIHVSLSINKEQGNLYVRCVDNRPLARYENYILELRSISLLKNLSNDQCAEWIRNTCESILMDVYLQKNANLNPLFALFPRAHQVSIDVARTMIIEGLPYMLRTLPGVRDNKQIRECLINIDESRRAKASAVFTDQHQSNDNKNIEETYKSLMSLVDHNSKAQQTILKAIRRRIIKYQYDISSIPFELLQNADDAILELEYLIEKYKVFYEKKYSFQVEKIEKTNTVVFSYWGRPINYTGGSNENYDFGNDLERMLMLGASEKETEKSLKVTGKFGLGFKSTLLACSTPKVSSGELSFQVNGGCLPTKWEPIQKSSATSIILELDENVTSEEVLGRFEFLAPYVCIFSRIIDQIDISNKCYQWKPKNISIHTTQIVETFPFRIECENGASIQIGDYLTSQKDVPSSSLFYVDCQQKGSILLRFNKSGFLDFPIGNKYTIPLIWVTLPTRGTHSKGIMINAPFEIDAGRASISNGEHAMAYNTDICEKLANAVSGTLLEFYNHTLESWETMKTLFRLSNDLKPSHFWFSLFEIIMGEIPNEYASTDIIIKEIFGRNVIKSMFNRIKAIPNGFYHEYSDLTSITRISLSIPEELHFKEFLDTLEKWPLFSDKYPRWAWCSEKLSRLLKRCNVALPINFENFNEETIGKCISDEKINSLEIEYIIKILNAIPNSSELHKSICNLLTRKKYLTKNKTWTSINKIIIYTDRKDINLMLFTPLDRQLDEKYFRLIEKERLRNLLQTTYPLAGDIVEWAIGVRKDLKRTVIKWLLDNTSHDAFRKLLSLDYHQTWIRQLNQYSGELQDLSLEDRKYLLRKLNILENNSIQNTSLNDIFNWWSDNRENHLNNYRKAFWPENITPLLHADPIDRSAWMALFCLAISQRHGRVTENQNRGFIEYLIQREWWDRLCTNPDEHRAKKEWMQLLDEYVSDTNISQSYEMWMDSFTVLYKISKWLDTYVHLFKKIDHMEGFNPNFLNLHSNHHLHGAGIHAPSLVRYLKLGKHFIVRELLLNNVLQSEQAKRLAYAPGETVLSLLKECGIQADTSDEIYSQLQKKIYKVFPQYHQFEKDYDIPLIMYIRHAR